MTRIQTDEQGRRYAEKPNGTRVYLPPPGPVDPKAVERTQQVIESYHRVFRVEEEDEEDPPDCAYCRGSGLSPHSIRDVPCPYCGGR